MPADTERVDHVLHDMLREGVQITVYLDNGVVFSGALSSCHRASNAWILRSGNGANQTETWFTSAHVQAIRKGI